MKKITLLLVATAILFSCSKNGKEENKAAKSGPGVHVRIQNATAIALEGVGINQNSYGNIIIGLTTSYQLLADPIYAPYCNFTMNGNKQMAGYGVCGSPLPPPIADGYYTFKVVTDPAGYYTIVMTED